MAVNSDPERGINSWLEDELYRQYLRDRSSVDEGWKQIFEEERREAGDGRGLPETDGAPPAPARPAMAPPAAPPDAAPAGTENELQPLRGAAGRIAANMSASVAIPLATSQRTIAVKVMDENRRIINQHRGLLGKSKVSYTHLIGWAIVRAIEELPTVNYAYAERDGQPCRVIHPQVHLGIAVDVAGKNDGSRSLMVPNIKNAGSLSFAEYLAAFDDLVARARTGRLTPADFQGTTISLTNPGTVGTMSSNPRLMPGQGAIIATGAIDYPAEYRGTADETRAVLGISKVMVLSCTYDHRIIQGAESGAFLGKLQSLLDGADGFYEEIFNHLRMPHMPVHWETDRGPRLPGTDVARYAQSSKELGVIQMINAYRVRGHLVADLDPLGSEPHFHPELDPETYGLTIWDLDREFLTGSLGEAIGEGSSKPVATLREILETLRDTYCGKIGCEYMNIQVPEQKRWLQQRMEPGKNHWPLERSTRLRILRNLIDAEEFEHFLHSRFVGQKRFALEGGETALAIMEEILERAAANNVNEVVIGMAHRGRLNLLANVVGKDLRQIFSEFEGEIDPSSTQGSGDVKYHLGATGTRKMESGREIVVSVSPNPSHLEAVDPVVEGIVRPKQDRLGDTARERVIPVLVHGDAAFAGQGVVAETLNLSGLDGYTTGGTIHVIINNQIGFTTLPDESRSTPYSTDVARGVQAPIFHVNGDSPQAAVRVVQVAFDYRQKFQKDVVIDMFCYRRHGHNEGDDPSYTQPILYRKIKEHPSVATLYGERLVREGVLTAAEVAGMRKAVAGRLSQAYDAVQQRAERYELQELSAVASEEIGNFCPRTAVNHLVLERVARGITHFPENFHLHPKLRGFVERRHEALLQAAKPAAIDWAFAEALAFGTLVLEGTAVRLSGQDSGRGTFSQRHLAFYDAETGKRYIPLQHVSPDQARFDVYDSSLSEYAVLGFEFGYSVADPLTLVIWEAQFGDFANGAQIMIDQFISSCESKWGQPSGLVMLLPHGFEGQGPEHSSARIERYLTLCAENNMQVANCTTPAQYFHLLRRQMYGGADRRGVRKPLVIFTPKSLLRHPRAVSAPREFTAGGFMELLADPASPEVTRVVFCSGKVYYDLAAAREERQAHHVALVRVEQLYPFDAGQAADILSRYPLTAELVWAQEEPRNMGPWRFVREWMEPLLEPTHRELRYVGRPESASPATGSGKRHQQEQAEIVNDALTPGAISETRKVRLVSGRKK